MMPEPQIPSPPASGHGSLSSREREVLAWIGNGYTNDEIAYRLYLSVNSVKTYVRSAYKKIGASSRSQAVLWAICEGLVDLPDDCAPSSTVDDDARSAAER